MRPDFIDPAPLSRRPLLITDDPELIEDVLHLAAAAGVDLHVSSHADASRGSWAASPLVLIGADALGGLIRRPLERRRDVVVVLRQAVDETNVHGDRSPEPWRDAVTIGAEHVIVLPEANGWLGDRLSGALEGPARNGSVLAVAAACGGAGASTMACALALSAQRAGRSVLLVDLDPFGGGLDLVLGCEAMPGLRWSDVIAADGRISASSLDAVLPHPHGLALLSHGRVRPTNPDPQAVAAVVDAGVRGYDLVILDLARIDQADDWSGNVQSMLWLMPNRVRPIAATAASLPRVREGAPHVHVVLRRSARGIPAREAQDALGVSIVAEIDDDPRIPAAAEAGEMPPEGLLRSAGQVLTVVGQGAGMASTTEFAA